MEDYGICAKLSVPYTRNVILSILERGKELGCIYYDYILGERYAESPILNALEATNKVLAGQPEEKDMNSIYVKYKDTFFHLFFLSEKEILSVQIGAFGYEWGKDFIHKRYHIDLSRYAGFFIELLGDFKIINFDISSV